MLTSSFQCYLPVKYWSGKMWFVWFLLAVFIVMLSGGKDVMYSSFVYIFCQKQAAKTIFLHFLEHYVTVKWWVGKPWFFGFFAALLQDKYQAEKTGHFSFWSFILAKLMLRKDGDCWSQSLWYDDRFNVPCTRLEEENNVLCFCWV